MKISILLCLLLCALSRRDPYKQGVVEGQIQGWFAQTVDHFDYTTQSTFQQRYWVIGDYFNPNAGPVFLFICGEYVCRGVPSQRQWVVTLAQRTMGLILVLQHRFYGQSLPFSNNSFTLPYLKYLSAQQALRDLAHFTEKIAQQSLYGVTKDSPWISIGGSYPGALSAWYRSKYPHLTIGAIASSAVVAAITNFNMFDEQMFMSANLSGPYCVQAINNSNIKVQSILNSQDGALFKSKFSADKLTNDEFLFFWIDSIVGEIQYGRRTKLCESLRDLSADQQFAVLTKLALGNSAVDYGSYYLRNATFAAENGQGARSWIFQSCTEFGYWQTPSLRYPLRSQRLNIDFYKKLCSDSYGNGVWTNEERTNTQFGGLALQATNLWMTNGVEDPWRWASMQSTREGITSEVANCTNCAHCVDLYTIDNNNDAQPLKKIRAQQFLDVQNWIEDYWRNHKKNKNSFMMDLNEKNINLKVIQKKPRSERIQNLQIN